MDGKIKFSKYQGAGNDFVLIDNRSGFFDGDNHDLVQLLCNRRFGIGADGLMLLQNNKNFDFEMVYYNANGGEASMCGNGGRCIVAFARDLGIITDKTVFLAVDGKHDAHIHDNQVDLGMIDVSSVERDGAAYVLNTGSPHYVTWANDLKNMDVYHIGSAIRNNDTYQKDGINVNFLEKEGNGYFVRTFERGVEDETFACGTGATASAMAIALHENLEGELEIPIRVLGGQLYISFHKQGQQFTNVRLKGPAQFVFEGTFLSPFSR
ncbi:diaminopimelate epimerase [Sphingobacterium chuzhouense]|uniref:Diaminopimelate epimerase n=1 Tax=Sphingobacterium chuzhouense TaxID=1742264 RepID=A0ABR7XNQ5_9SPHI|nr:diaminopimelate epimerase [Sphingobacterium chuzhouense]MBD1420808.1 diaminopimelate epimerase [Sphingobacterium chuzhouense]